MEKHQNKISVHEWLGGTFGIEREAIRITKDGQLSQQPHPTIFQQNTAHPYVTKDFAESQIEMITPVFPTLHEAHHFLSALYDIVVREIGEELLWPQSMPPIVSEDDDVQVAQFPHDMEATRYREGLKEKYGAKKQLISGIHFNYGMSDTLLHSLHKRTNKELDIHEFKDTLYLNMAKRYKYLHWLVNGLMGATNIVHASYVHSCVEKLEEVAPHSYSAKEALSFRNSLCGYRNEQPLYPNLKTVRSFVDSIHTFIEQGHITHFKEYYSPIRLKPSDPNQWGDSLANDGIAYIEVRNIDSNPFEKTGVSLQDLQFVQWFLLYCATNEIQLCDEWQQEAEYNSRIVAIRGLHEHTYMKHCGQKRTFFEWGQALLTDMIRWMTEEGIEDTSVIDNQLQKLKNHEQLYAKKIINMVRETDYVTAHIQLAMDYKEASLSKSFRLEGYTDLELSTQILLRESIRRGLHFSVVDRVDNFVKLWNGEGKVEWVKQATKTSLDDYVTVLKMENKVVTKIILDEHGITVPQGEEFHDMNGAIVTLHHYVGKSIVIKPKSTNFGLGIQIFPHGGTEEELVAAVQHAFKYDDTVLIEQFIRGKEYRFLVIGDEVVGVLHRVPANVRGDGVHCIEQLIHIKNEDPLRGYKYKTPLEKIQIDESLVAFLKQQNRSVGYVPAKGERVFLRENSNISTGGDSIDYTDDVHSYYKNRAIQSAQAIGAVICGVDMIIQNLEEEDAYGIIELNFNPAIHIHAYPFQGKERNAATKILSLLQLI